MFRFTILLLITVISGITSSAQSIVVKGKVEGGSSYIIRLIKVTDLVSFSEKTISIDTINPDNTFILSASIDQTEYCYLDVELQRNEIFIQPGQDYSVDLRFDPDFRLKPYFDQKPLDIEFVKDDKDQLNLNIRKANQIYNDFILKNFNAIYKQGKKYLADTLKQQLNRSFWNISNTYFKDYLHYKFASIDQFSKTLSRQALAQKYLINNPVLYNNLEYMYFFNEFYEKYLITSHTGMTFNKADVMLNQRLPLKDFLLIIQEDPLLADPTLAEFFLMRNLIDLYRIGDLPKDQILKLLQEIYFSSKVEEHRQVSLDIMNRLTEFNQGTPAPVFSLVDEKGNVYNNQSFRGKYLYLGFVLARSPVCRNDLDSLNLIYDNFRDKIEVVFVSADKDQSTWSDYAASKGFPWKMLHYHNNIELLQKFRVSTFPVYILIDKNGLIRNFPAKPPSEDLESLFNSLK